MCENVSSASRVIDVVVISSNVGHFGSVIYSANFVNNGPVSATDVCCLLYKWYPSVAEPKLLLLQKQKCKVVVYELKVGGILLHS